MEIVRSYKNRRKKHVCVNKVYENKKNVAAALDSTVKKCLFSILSFKCCFFVLFCCFIIFA